MKIEPFAAELRGEVPLKGAEVLVREQHESHLLDPWMLLELFVRCAERVLSGSLDRIAVNARRDRREGDRAAAELVGDFECTPMAGRKQLRLALIATAPDRADGVDHVPGRKVAGGRGLGVPRRATAEPTTLLENRSAAGAVNRPVYASTAEQRLVRRVHDRVHVLLRDVALHELDPAHRLKPMVRMEGFEPSSTGF
jgi:hypothetical protein